MYDEGKEFVAETQAEAIERAVSHFGVPADRLDVRVISDALEISGLGESVMIVAMSLDAAQPTGGGHRERRERSARPGRSQRPERPERSERRERQRPERGEPRDRPGRGERVEAREALGPPVVEVVGELTEAGEFARELFQRLELPGATQLEERNDDDEIVLRVGGQSVVEAARRDDRFLGSVAHLVERGLRWEDREPSVYVEIAGDDPKELELEALARERGEEVARTGEPIELEPMNARERWVVHNALKQVLGVRSSSAGEGRVRRVTIEPA